MFYRTTDATRWGLGTGTNLVAGQVDQNFFSIDQALEAATSHIDGMVVSIDHVGIVGNQLTVFLTDHSRQGPFTIPTAQWVFLGPWQPTAVYARNGIVTDSNSVYLILQNHISGAHFNPDALDGNGHPLYGLMLSPPDGVLPPHGEAGQILIKRSSADFDVEWSTIVSIPAGGIDGQVLTKNSSHDYDVSWINVPHPPPAVNNNVGHSIDYTLTLNDANTYMIVDNPHDVIIFVPLNTHVTFVEDTEIHFRQEGLGRIIFEAHSGVSLNGDSGGFGIINQTPTQGAVCTMKLVNAASNVWDLYGLLLSHE